MYISYFFISSIYILCGPFLCQFFRFIILRILILIFILILIPPIFYSLEMDVDTEEERKNWKNETVMQSEWWKTSFTEVHLSSVISFPGLLLPSASYLSILWGFTLFSPLSSSCFPPGCSFSLVMIPGNRLLLFPSSVCNEHVTFLYLLFHSYETDYCAV